MKKLLILLLSLVLIAGCGQKKTEEPAQKDNETKKSEVATFGLGHHTSIAQSANADGEKSAVADAQTTVAAVCFDAEGKIVAVKIDGFHGTVKFNKEMKFAEDYSTKQYQSTKLQKEAYNMKDASPIKKEWYEQVNHLEKWLVGKTVADAVKGMDSKNLDADLKTGATINMNSFVEALKAAEANKVEAQKATKLGLGLVVKVAKQKETDKPFAQFNYTFAAVALDEAGKIVKTSINAVQAKPTFNMEGVLQNQDKTVLSKKELKEKYLMKEASPIKKEWYEQANALEAFLVGKDEQQALNLKTKSEKGHPNKLDEPELKTSATIDVTDIKQALSLAFTDAK